MSDVKPDPIDSLTRHAPFCGLPHALRSALAPKLARVVLEQGAVLFEKGAPLAGLYVVETGGLDIETGHADLVSHRGPGDIMGERGLLRDGNALLTARASEPSDRPQMQAVAELLAV